MKTYAFCSLGAFVALALAAGGCELIAAVDHDLIPQGGGLVGGAGGTGGAASSSTTSTGGGGMGGSGGMPSCIADECPDPGSDCLMKACDGDMCDATPPPVAAETPCNSLQGEGGGSGGMAGVCDGAGECVECVDNDQCTAPDTCDQNVCVPPHCMNMTQDADETDEDCGGADCAPCMNGQGCDDPTDCTSNYCSGGATCAACTGTGAGECAGTEYCNAGVCETKKADGASCMAGFECANGNCPTTGQGGVCCDVPCTADCQSCAMADTGTANGTCADVTPGTDPKNLCTNDATGCEADNCAAGGQCASATGESCGTPSCTGNTLTPNACNATLTCEAATPAPCPNNFVCQSATACFTTCTAHANCVSTHYCGGVGGAGGTAGQCNAKGAADDPCTVGDECLSGTCTAMVCE